MFVIRYKISALSGEDLFGRYVEMYRCNVGTTKNDRHRYNNIRIF